MYFVFCVDSSESELGILDLIQVSIFCCSVFLISGILLLSTLKLQYLAVSFSVVFGSEGDFHTVKTPEVLSVAFRLFAVFRTVFEKVVSQVDKKVRKEFVWNLRNNQQLFFFFLQLFKALFWLQVKLVRFKHLVDKFRI